MAKYVCISSKIKKKIQRFISIRIKHYPRVKKKLRILYKFENNEKSKNQHLSNIKKETGEHWRKEMCKIKMQNTCNGNKIQVCFEVIVESSS